MKFAVILCVAALGNIALLYALMAWRIGEVTLRIRRKIAAPRDRLWNALWPLGESAGWSGQILEAQPLGDDGAQIALSWEGRDGLPIRHTLAFEDFVNGERYTSRVVEDTSLDPEFWRSYRQTTRLTEHADGTEVEFVRADSYRGLAFLIFRYFAMRREITKLKVWAETGRYRAGGLIERPIVQVGFALLSVLIFWPAFGLNANGFALAVTLTLVVALHELGHMAAFRVVGHRHTRMIFIPGLGGIAIGGRPYDSRFEVGFVALMGAGLSAFVVIAAMGASQIAEDVGLTHVSVWAVIFVGCGALFNLANLIPVWKFDGGQVLRQAVETPLMRALGSFLLLAAFIGLGARVGFPLTALLVGAGVFALLGIMTSGSGVKPRHELKPMQGMEQTAIALGLVATFAIHAFAIVWAANQIAGRLA